MLHVASPSGRFVNNPERLSEDFPVPVKIRMKPKPKPANRAKNERSLTVSEIVAAATQLRPNVFLQLRDKLDAVEERQWRSSLAKITKRTRAKGITDEEIDELVMRRRRESRR